MRTDSDDMWEDQQQWSGEENWSGAGNNASWWPQAEYGSASYGEFRESQNFWQAYPDGYPHPFAQGGDEGKLKEKRQKFT
jgi:hypothetical protein